MRKRKLKWQHTKWKLKSLLPPSVRLLLISQYGHTGQVGTVSDATGRTDSVIRSVRKK